MQGSPPRPPVVAGTRMLMDAPRQLRQGNDSGYSNNSANDISTIRELTPTELLQQPSATLAKILRTLDRFVDELHNRAVEGSVTLKDIKALADLVRAHSQLRQTQLLEDESSRRTQGGASDAEIAQLLIAAVKAGGPEAKATLAAALIQLENGESLK